MLRRLLLVFALLAPLLAAAQGVALAGRLGAKALLVIDGKTQVLAVGESARGIKLLSFDGEQARIEQDGQVGVLRVGAAPVSLGGSPVAAGKREIVITAGPGGHFVTQGQINGRSVSFMVDTGATTVALGQSDAQRLGIDLRNAKTGLSGTANGVVPVQHVTLTSVRVGGIEMVNVEATVMPTAMPYVLLGNSFLSRFQMRRDNDVLRMEPR